ncbi:MAG: ribbon-helix-helix domain-containing protein [Candidatus Levybacteria bacterium]|nr:ribbon-helix-helix domain-containing protein [Candidatus Levybacteria bacterium]
MIRTQIYLPKELYQEIDLVAKKENKPKAEIIREAVEEALEKKRGNAGDVLLKLAKMAKKYNWKGPKDLSKNIDKYLYEEA